VGTVGANAKAALVKSEGVLIFKLKTEAVDYGTGAQMNS
jgi:hypothetical protein